MREKGAEGIDKDQHLETPAWFFKKFGIYSEDIWVSLQALNRNNMMRFAFFKKWLLKSILCKEISTFPMIWWCWSRTVFS